MTDQDPEDQDQSEPLDPEDFDRRMKERLGPERYLQYLQLSERILEDQRLSVPSKRAPKDKSDAELQDPEGLMVAGMNVVWHEHAYPASITDHDYVIETVGGIESDFANNMAQLDGLAARLVKLFETVAAGDCLGCRNVLLRISMMIEDLEDNLPYPDHLQLVD